MQVRIYVVRVRCAGPTGRSFRDYYTKLWIHYRLVSGNKAFFQKNLEKTGFSFHKEAVLEVAPSNVYTIHFLLLEKIFFGGFKKSHFWSFRAI